MKNIKKFFTILILTFFFVNSSNGQEQIVFLDLDNVVSNTNAGKSILDKLEKSKKETLLKFEKKEKDLKKIEDQIKKQKNIISENELKKKLAEFSKEVNIFRQNRQKVINEFNQKKSLNLMFFLKKLLLLLKIM